MKLEDYFTFLAPDDIRLRGTRVGRETILSEYIYRHQSPETIAKTYTNLSLEQIYWKKSQHNGYVFMTVRKS